VAVSWLKVFSKLPIYNYKEGSFLTINLMVRRMVMKKLFVLAVLCFIVLAGSTAMAEKPLTPETVKGATVVDDAFVKANHGKIKIYDVRKKAEYVESHIAGAISAPYEENSELTPKFDASKDKLDLSKFPADKNEPIINYCNGPRCWKSYKATILLVKAGYTKVSYYREGFPSWKAKGYPVE
jgi:rhodanese-related sulfurtransferase